MHKTHIFLFIFISLSCAKQQAQNGVKEAVRSENTADSPAKPASDFTSTKKFGTVFVTSLSNEPLSSRKINTDSAAAIANKSAKTEAELQSTIYGDRLAGGSVQSIFAKAKALVAVELKKGVDRDIGDSIKLELALAAIHDKKFGFAKLYLNQLVNSNNSKVKAGALNAQGVLAMSAGDLPAATTLFKGSLKASDKFPAALFNLGFLAVKYGDFDSGKIYLEQLGDDWYAQAGILVATRHLGDNTRTENICNRLLSSHSNHKMVLFNCGLYFGQNKGDKAKGKELITRSLKIPGGPERWEEAGYKVLEGLGL